MFKNNLTIREKNKEIITRNKNKLKKNIYRKINKSNEHKVFQTSNQEHRSCLHRTRMQPLQIFLCHLFPRTLFSFHQS